MNNVIETIHGKMNYYYRQAEGTPITIVFLEGFGGTNAYYNFKAIIDRLPNQYGILTLDYLGYGLSEVTNAPRTIENMRSELDKAIETFNLTSIVLFAHSIGGFFGFDYYLHFPNNIIGFIGIEPTTYEVIAAHPEGSEGYLKEAEMFRRLSSEQQEKQLSDYDGQGEQNPFLNEEEAKKDLEISKSKAFNINLIDQTRRSLESLQTIKGKQISAELPTLILSTNKRAQEFAHASYLSKHKLSKLVSLDCNHYLHWSCPEKVAYEAKNFLAEIERLKFQ